MCATPLCLFHGERERSICQRFKNVGHLECAYSEPKKFLIFAVMMLDHKPMEVFLKTSLIITQAQGAFIAEMRVKGLQCPIH